jgi:hypothetical protein
LKANSALLGRKVKCPDCGEMIKVKGKLDTPLLSPVAGLDVQNASQPEPAAEKAEKKTAFWLAGFGCLALFAIGLWLRMQ